MVEVVTVKLSMATRSTDSKLPILLETPGIDDLKICGSRLPSVKQVLFCFMANLEKMRQDDPTKQRKLYRTCANLVVQEVLGHYGKSHIPTIHRKKMAEKIVGLYQEYRSLLSTKSEKRAGNKKIQLFQEKLKTTMQFWPKDVEKRLESKKHKSPAEQHAVDEDLKFLQSMKTDRVAQYTGKDQAMAYIQKARSIRKEKSVMFAQKSLTEEPGSSALTSSSDSTLSEDEGIIELPPSRTHKRNVKKGTTIFVPHDVLKHPAVVSSATRNKLSATAIADTLRTLITVCGGDPSSVNLHFSSAHRYVLNMLTVPF